VSTIEQGCADAPTLVPRTTRRLSATAAERAALPLLFVAVVVFFAVLPSTRDTFPTLLNFQTVAAGQSILGVIALAAIVPLIAGQFDLSVGSNVGLTSMLVAGAASGWGFNVWQCLLAGVAIGVVIGVFNGYLVSALGVNALIATLATATIMDGLARLYSGGLPIVTGIPAGLTTLGNGRQFGIPNTFLILIVVAVSVELMLGYTPFGRYIRAVGVNASASRLVGVRVRPVVFASYVLAGALCGLAATLQVGRQGGGNPQVGAGFLLPALAAIFLGTTTFRASRYNVPGTMIAVFFLAASVSGLNLAGVQSWVQPVFNGGALLVAVVGSRLLSGRSLDTGGI
jgi:ribose transport system permease protein